MQTKTVSDHLAKFSEIDRQRAYLDAQERAYIAAKAADTKTVARDDADAIVRTKATATMWATVALALRPVSTQPEEMT